MTGDLDSLVLAFPQPFRAGVLESIEACTGKPRVVMEAYLAMMTVLCVGKVALAHVLRRPWAVGDGAVGEAIDLMRRIRAAVREGVRNGAS